ncbi:MAG: hypothetical protein R2862_07770 [Thermoanaerobaculia bacterium]
MRATEFEFRHRFWLISAIFVLSFALYRFDPRNLGVALLERLRRSGSTGSLAGRRDLRILFLGAAALVVLAALLRTWATAFLSSDVVHDSALRQDRLVADGPFRPSATRSTSACSSWRQGWPSSVRVPVPPCCLAALPLLGLRLIGLEEERLLATAGELPPTSRGCRGCCRRLLRGCRPRAGRDSGSRRSSVSSSSGFSPPVRSPSR